MVNAIVQLAVVVYLILSVLVSAPRCELNKTLFVDEWGLLPVDILELAVIRHRGIKGREYDRLSGGIPQGGIHGIEVQLGEAVPGLLVRVLRDLIPVETVRVVVGELSPNHFLLLLVEDL